MLIDESGFFLNPLVRRTWAPRGKTLVLPSWERQRDKVSVIAAVSVVPTLRRLGLSWLADPKHYIAAPTVAEVPASPPAPPARAHHRGVGRRHQPPGAFDPCLWGHLKHGRLPNFVPANLAHLDQTLRHELDSARQTRGPAQSPVAWLQATVPTLHFCLTEDQ